MREVQWHLAVTPNFNAGGAGSIKRSNVFQDVSLSDWLTHWPPVVATTYRNSPLQDLAKFPKNAPAVAPV
jgi:hypothetical protein